MKAFVGYIQNAYIIRAAFETHIMMIIILRRCDHFFYEWITQQALPVHRRVQGYVMALKHIMLCYISLCYEGIPL